MHTNFKILIVDDDQINISILKEILEEKYIVETEGDGDSALKILPKFHPDLILLDIMMPGIDGIEVCRRIRKDKRYRFMKVILVSGKTMVSERLEGYNAGADDYITKPFVEEELMAKLSVYLQFKRTEEINQIKEDLLHLISHETRTPLSGIIGSAEILKTDNSLSHDAKKFLEIIYQSGTRLNDFLTKTILLCQLKSGIDLNKMYGSISTHLKSRLAMLDNIALKKNITFKLEVSEDINLNADWALLDIVFDYLLDNAAKFSQDATTTKIQLESKGGCCLIRIINQGKVIEQDWIDKIFDEFAIQDVEHHEKGQGLSLAIARYIIEQHDGSIHVDSSLDSRTTFTIRLPHQDIFNSDS